MSRRLPIRSSVCAALLLAGLACDKPAPAGEGDDKAAAAQPEGEAKPEGEAAAKDDTAASSSAKRATGEDGKTRLAKAKAKIAAEGDKAKSARVKLNRLLNDGRKAVKDKRYDEGIALYRKALEIDPVHPKVLGELGFAALRKGDLELAESMTRRAIDLTKGTKGLGALYYNLGRVEEQRGELLEARAAYERSLEVRPGNDIVQGRLDGLVIDPATKGPGSAADLCAELRDEWQCYASEQEIEALPEDEQYDAGLCDCSVDTEIQEGTGASFIEAAALLALDGMAGYGGTIEDKYLAVKTRGHGWQMIGLAVNGYTPGVMGISNEGRVVSFEFDDIAASPGEELRLVTENSEVDSDLGVNLIHFFDVREQQICHATGKDGAICGALIVSLSSSTQPLMDDEPVEPGFEDDVGDESWAFEVSFDAGQLELRVDSGKAAMEPETAARAGKRSVEDTLGLPGVETTTLH